MSEEQPASDRLLTKFPPAVIDSEQEGAAAALLISGLWVRAEPHSYLH